MGLGRVDGARDAWMGPGLRGRGQKVHHCHGGQRGAGGRYGRWRYQGHARACGGQEGERQDTDKGGYAWQGMYTESLRVDMLGFCGQGVTADEGHLWQGEGSRRANKMVDTPQDTGTDLVFLARGGRLCGCLVMLERDLSA